MNNPEKTGGHNPTSITTPKGAEAPDTSPDGSEQQVEPRITIAEDLLERPESAPGAVSGASAKLVTRDMHFFYGDFRALRNISIEIPENRVTAIIGPSGCGKSTLLR